ncbi:MAG: hypothetical protein IMF07_05995, partial [Proteobacteria bacterium]|nr:hypothetical protein [Pseudomonadota bacterium]
MPETDNYPMLVRFTIQSLLIKTFTVVSFVLFFSSLSIASPDEYVDSIIKALLREGQPVSYKAEEVVIFFSDLEAPRVHSYKTGVLKPYKMRRESYGIDGSVEEVIVHDSEMQIVYYPSEKMVLRSPREKLRTSPLVTELTRLIKANYDVYVEGEAKVSGRKVSIVSIMPKERGTRPGFKVWLDQEYLLPLKTETYDLEGNISYQNTYRKLVINPSFNQGYFVIMVPPGAAAYELPSSSSGNLEGNEMPKLKHVSGGYVLKEAFKDGDEHFQIIYHDGLNSISVFIEDWNEAENLSAGKMFSRSGAMLERINFKGLDATFCKRGSK